MTMATCAKCGVSNLSVTITATCSKCKASVTLCHTCKLAWNINNCPSCGAKPIQASWNYRDTSGSGSDGMLSYLDDVGLNPKTYVAAWNASKEKRLAEREKNGRTAHRNVALPEVEVDFLRKLEDFMCEPIYTIADDRANYVVVENGHVVKLRLLNADVRNNLPTTISQFEKLREFWYERGRNEKGSLQNFPETFGDCTSLEVLVIRGAPNKLPSPPKFQLKKLALPMANSIDPNLLCPTLEELALGGCRLSPEEFEKIGTMANLKKLSLSFTTTTAGTFDKLPECLKKLTSLEELDLRGDPIGKYKNTAWPAWLVEIPKLKLIHRDVDCLWGWDVIEKALHERNPEANLGNVLDPEMASRKMNLSDMKEWWNANNSEILKIGWTGIASRV